MDKEIKKLILFINKLSEFELYESLDEIYSHGNHMGAVIVDGSLQAGIKYDTVVKPRVKKIKKIKEAKTTKGFYSLYNEQGLEELINFRGKKIDIIKNLVNLFIREKIDIPEEFKKWLEDDRNLEKLIMINGIGEKTVDYFKILAGISTVAIDRHLINFLKKADIEISINDYEKAQKIIILAADDMKIDRALLDYSIWRYMSDKSKNKNKQNI